jgi:Putative adhesin
MEGRLHSHHCHHRTHLMRDLATTQAQDRSQYMVHIMGRRMDHPPRRRSPWPWIVLTVVLVLAFTGFVGMLFAAFGYNFAGYTSTLTETRHFTVTTAPTVVINNDIGNIRVQAGSTGSDVTIQAFKYAGFGGNMNDVQVNYNQSSNANTITVNVNRSTNFNFFNSPKVDFEVTVPGTAALELKTNTGSIDVSGVSGRMSLTSNTGSVDVRNGALTSSSILSSNTGSISFNGSIDKTGAYQFTTNTGSVNVTLPASSVFHVDATTDTGSITSDFPGVTVDHPNFTGAVAHGDVGNSPQATVTLRTNTGSIYLHQS